RIDRRVGPAKELKVPPPKRFDDGAGHLLQLLGDGDKIAVCYEALVLFRSKLSSNAFARVVDQFSAETQAGEHALHPLLADAHVSSHTLADFAAVLHVLA